MTASEDKMQTCTVGENIKLADFVKGEEVERWMKARQAYVGWIVREIKMNLVR